MKRKNKRRGTPNTTEYVRVDERLKKYIQKLNDIIARCGRGYTPRELPGRTEQVRLINEMVEFRLKKSLPYLFFIHGNPGCGKTETVTFTLRKLKEQYEIDVLYLTNINYAHSHVTRQKLYRFLTGEIADCTTKTIPTRLARYFRKSRSKSKKQKSKIPEYDHSANTKVIILDEFDQFIHTDKKMGMKLMEFTDELKFQNSSILLFCISNFPADEEWVKLSRYFQSIEYEDYTRRDLYQIIKSRISEYEMFDDKTMRWGVRQSLMSGADARTLLNIFTQTCRQRVRVYEHKLKEYQKRRKELMSGRRRGSFGMNQEKKAKKSGRMVDEEAFVPDEEEEMERRYGNGTRGTSKFSSRLKRKREVEEEEEDVIEQKEMNKEESLDNRIGVSVGEDGIDIKFFKKQFSEQTSWMKKRDLATKIVLRGIIDLWDRSKASRIGCLELIDHVNYSIEDYFSEFGSELGYTGLDKFRIDSFDVKRVAGCYGINIVDYRDFEKFKHKRKTFLEVDISEMVNPASHSKPFSVRKIKKVLEEDEEVGEIEFMRFDGL